MKTQFTVKLPILACLLMLAGCGVLNKQSPEDLSWELGYTNTVRQKYTVDEQWWKKYNNSNINRLVNSALSNNPDYIKAAININKELYNLNLKTADLFPSLSGELGASSQRAAFENDHSVNNFSGELGLSYEADLYGKIRDTRSAQEFEYKATLMDKETARLSLINSVIDLYFNLEYLNNSLSLTRENINSYQSIKNIIQAKHTSGKVDGLELAQAEQNLLSEQKKILDLETQIREMEQSLRNILMMTPGQNLGIRYSSILNQKALNVNVNVPLAVLANRPDLNASQYRLEKAFKNLEAEEKNWYPGVSVKGSLSSSSDKAARTFDVPYVFGSVSVSLPFLDWERVKNNIKISEADYQISLVDFKDALNQALNEVAYYYFAYQKSVEIFKNTQKNYNQASQISSYYKTRYASGKSELKDYLEAINTENSLKKDLVQQKYQIIKYENYVYKAMGGRYSSSK